MVRIVTFMFIHASLHAQLCCGFYFKMLKQASIYTQYIFMTM